MGVIDDEDEEMLKWTAATLYGGGADTVCRHCTGIPYVYA